MKALSFIVRGIAALSLCVPFLSTPASANSAVDPDIRLNQAGYYTHSRKVAVVVNNAGNIGATGFQVVRVSDGRVMHEGSLSALAQWAESGETGRRAEFSLLDLSGQYKIVLNNKNKSESYPFRIAADIYNDVARASLRTFYYQRCSYELLAKFAGSKWARAAGHIDTAVTFHASSGRDTSSKLNSPGGWYDAGDFGKYTVNSGITVGTLMAFYELFPEYFRDKTLNIPESGNDWPDILDEVKYNLDWMRTMQDADGGVFFKLTTLSFPGYVLPVNDNWERFVIGKSTTSALNFAAAMAMAGRVYAPFDKAYAASCVVMAKKAWEWAEKNPDVPFKNPDDVKTGEYRDVSFDDEFVWAAAELYITTKEKRFADFLKGKDIMYTGEPSWQNVRSLGPLSLSVISNGLPKATVDSVRASIVRQADAWIDQMDKHLYRIPNTNFIWGSNSNFANMGIGMIYAHRITKDSKYLLAAAEVADYLMGKNAIGISFMTGIGTRFAANPHHRQVVATQGLENRDAKFQARRQFAPIGAEVVIPGFLVGGPNKGQQDKQHGVTYSSSLPAKSYEDVYKSYASNEVAINWNAPATFLFGALDVLMPNIKR